MARSGSVYGLPKTLSFAGQGGGNCALRRSALDIFAHTVGVRSNNAPPVFSDGCFLLMLCSQ